MYFLLEHVNFYCHVCFLEGTPKQTKPHVHRENSCSKTCPRRLMSQQISMIGRDWHRPLPVLLLLQKVAMTFHLKRDHFKREKYSSTQHFEGEGYFSGEDWGETLPPRMPVATSYWQGKTSGTLWWPGCFGWSEKALFWRVNPSNIEVMWALGIYIYIYILYVGSVFPIIYQPTNQLTMPFWANCIYKNTKRYVIIMSSDEQFPLSFWKKKLATKLG